MHKAVKDVAINNLAKVFPTTGYFVFVITNSHLILQTCKHLHILVFIGIECGQSAELRDVACTQVLRELGFQGHKTEDAPYISNLQL